MNPFFGRSSGLMLALTLGVCSSFYIMQPALKQQR
ncbi:uncharacterized protein SOCG_05231 [Schizosaccharomyces octosporus yFS286]|uniref:Uncharacterized protein n=1 Tax=Schizosaccharomyces octosporus (strain yFS286) TaxID=483514 RepID=S9Q4W6_SCHOY|nr:uncharacterized protein SOCG_05231 [Schizosaccharomyces octosporus yFS286]EPX74668.1 hypothetical protein SOCG_05231 [Schizosaccharomyces octosporus yFS286]